MATINFTPISFEPLPTEKQQPVKPIDFKPIDFQPVSEVPAPTPPASKDLTDADYQKIGKEFGVNPQDLRDLAPYYGAISRPQSFPEALGQGAKGAAGALGRSVGLGVPQWAYKKLQDEPMQKAIDALTDLGESQRSGISQVAEAITGPTTLLKKGAGAGLRMAEAIGTGGVMGLTGSKTDEELKGAVTGATLGGAIGGAAESLGLLLNKLAPNLSEKALIENQSKGKQYDVQAGIEEVANRTRKSEEAIEDIAFKGKEHLSQSEVDTVLKERLGNEGLAKYLDSSSEEGKLVRQQMEGATGDRQIKEHLLDEIIETRLRNFAEDISKKKPKTGEEALDVIEKVASRQGEEATLNRYKEFVKLEQAEKHMAENGIRAVNEPNFFGKALDMMSDNQFVFRWMDDKFGTKLEDTVRDLNKAYNRSTFALQDFRNAYDDVFQKARKNGTDAIVVESDKIYQALDKGSLSGLTPQEAETARSFQSYFDRIRDYVNRLVKERDPRISPLNIPKMVNAEGQVAYAPHMLKATPDLITAVEGKQKEVLDILSQQLGRPVRDLSQLSPAEFKAVQKLEPINDLMRTVQLFDDKAPGTGADLSGRLKDMLYTREGNVALASKARAAMEREGQIPSYILEKNLYKLARRYTDNTIRHLYLRNGIDKLRYQSEALKKMGANSDAAYIDRQIQDILGVRKGTASEAMLQYGINSTRKLDKLIDQYGKDSIRGKALDLVRVAPSALEFLSRQIYPNLLGYFNVRAALQNATAALTKVAPELGTAYGHAAMLRGGMHTLLNLKRLVSTAREMGNVPAEFIRKGERAVAEGIARSAPAQYTKEALETMGKVGMKLYQGIEDFNRALVLGIGETMAHDLARGSNLALGALKKFPTDVRKTIIANRHSPELTSELIGKYLNDVTQYNYNKISMSEFGRTMGPLFSQFSKWPTATLGDIVYEMRNKGVVKSIPRNFEKYIAPFLVLQGIDSLMGEKIGDPDSLSPLQKKLVGSYGLSQSAPIGSIGGIMKGEIFTPPAADALAQAFIVPVMEDTAEGGVEKLGKGASSLTERFFPGAGLVRFITDDLVTYITGRRPEGSTFIERTGEGAKKIERGL